MYKAVHSNKNEQIEEIHDICINFGQKKTYVLIF